MAKYTLSINKNDCMGCHACEVACKMEHQLPVGPRLIRVIEKSPDYIPKYCRHCAKAPCIDACPAEAISRNGNGLVLIDDSKCIGCRECVQACPFEAMQFNEDSDVAVKCDMCSDRLAEGRGPACVATCSTRCITFHENGKPAWDVTAERG